MILAFDFGNTRVKAGLFEADSLETTWHFPYEEFESMLAAGAIPMGWRRAKYCGVLSVGKWPLDKIVNQLTNALPACTCLPLTAGLDTPLRNAYATPETLGMDRLALANGAWRLGGSKPLIAFSAGTALTWEVVDAEGTYLGGGISPGMRMRFQSLNAGTANLPLVEPDGTFSLAGQSTEESIRGGVMLGLVHQLEGLARQAKAELGADTQVFLTGGDLPFLINHLQSVNFADSGLVLKGIHAIVQYHFPDA